MQGLIRVPPSSLVVLAELNGVCLHYHYSWSAYSMQALYGMVLGCILYECRE